VLVDGADSKLTNTDIYYVGYQGSNNTLTLSNQGSLLSGNLTAGDTGSNNTILVTSNASMLIDGTLTLGDQGSNNTLTVSNNGTVSASVISIASQAGSGAL
jgi:T5SS/PEP-CTERM-associated repeat protein